MRAVGWAGIVTLAAGTAVAAGTRCRTGATWVSEAIAVPAATGADGSASYCDSAVSRTGADGIGGDPPFGWRRCGGIVANDVKFRNPIPGASSAFFGCGLVTNST